MLDQNDNTPSFVNPPSSVQVSEAARPGTNIVQLSAVDDDSQFNGDVEFNITRGDPEGEVPKPNPLNPRIELQTFLWTIPSLAFPGCKHFSRLSMIVYVCSPLIPCPCNSPLSKAD